LGYYLLFLPSFPGHAALMEQWSRCGVLKWKTLGAAYCLVGLLALLRAAWLRPAFGHPFSRFLAVAAGVSLLLAKHDLLLTARQPLHFTRGHIWLPLCLLGLPAVAALWRRAAGASRRRLLAACAALFALAMLTDNATFFYAKMSQPSGLVLSGAQRQALAAIDRQPGWIVLSDDPLLSYLSATYTSARPYWGHFYNTPGTPEKKAAVAEFFRQGVIPAELAARPLAVLVRETKNRERLAGDPRFAAVRSFEGIALFTRDSP
jgi:hypothetical protein